jgi:hypothetical protein
LENNFPCDKKSFEYAASIGDLKKMKWLYKTNFHIAKNICKCGWNWKSEKYEMIIRKKDFLMMKKHFIMRKNIET